MKVFLSVVLIFCLLLISYGALNHNKDETIPSEGEVHSGPVPVGYDIEYFRKTGMTVEEGSRE